LFYPCVFAFVLINFPTCLRRQPRAHFSVVFPPTVRGGSVLVTAGTYLARLVFNGILTNRSIPESLDALIMNAATVPHCQLSSITLSHHTCLM